MALSTNPNHWAGEYMVLRTICIIPRSTQAIISAAVASTGFARFMYIGIDHTAPYTGFCMVRSTGGKEFPFARRARLVETLKKESLFFYFSGGYHDRNWLQDLARQGIPTKSL